MAKATLLVNKISKNKFDAKLRFEDGSSKAFPGDFPKKYKKFDKQVVDVELAGEKIAKIQAGNDILYFAFGLRAPAPAQQAGNAVAPRTPNAAASKRGSVQSLDKQVERVKSPALAPYNFVPLNDDVFNIPPTDIPDFDCYDGQRFTGRIDLDIETVTPLYIRDTLNEEERNRDMKANENPDFFGPGGRLQIPGSSLRGMIRSLVEIVSFGKFGFVDDKNLYYRSFADVTTSLRNDYTSKMTESTKGAYSVQVQAGYLQHSGGNSYDIIPAKSIDNTPFYRIEEGLLLSKNDSDLYPEAMAVEGGFNQRTGKPYQKPNPNYRFLTRSVYFKKDAPRKHGRQYYGEVKDIQLDSGHKPDGVGWEKGMLVCTGWMQKKKRHWMVNAVMEDPDPRKDVLHLDEMVLKSYKDDVNRAEQADLLKRLRETEAKAVPCFYISEEFVSEKGERKEKVISFGHTGLFRLAYDLSIKDHVQPEKLLVEYCLSPERVEAMKQDFEHDKLDASVWGNTLDTFKKWMNAPDRYKISWKEARAFEKALKKALPGKISKREHYERIVRRHAQVVDLAGAIFGNEQTFAGRVFFENALLEEGKRNDEVLMGEAYPKILSSPKPTTFQHYLVQTEDNNRTLNHYNTSHARIRGNKLYWHKKIENKDWQETDQAQIRKHKSQYTSEINPVRPGTSFNGRIRFENLSSIELGALLFALKLPEGCHHKLGMGKPLGLGSIKIAPTLYLSQRVAEAGKSGRYNDLFCEWDSEPSAFDRLEEMQQAFAQKISQWLNHTGDLWQHERLKELETMLNYKKGIERQLSTRYMQIDGRNEFKYRPILPRPSDVKAIPRSANTNSGQQTARTSVKKNKSAASHR